MLIHRLTIMLKLRSMLYSLGTKAKTNIDYLGTTVKTNIDYLGTKAKTNISSLLIFLFFSLFIVYIFYNRLIRERLPRDLLEPVSSLQEYIYMYILGINIIILILLLWGKYQEYVDEAYEELGVERDVNKESIWYRLKEKLAKYSYDAEVKISQIYLSIIYPRWQEGYHRFLIECYISFNKLSPRVKLIYFYGILIIPKVIVAGIFLWDVLIQKELNLFYRVVWLLLLPLVFRFITYNYWVIVYTGIYHIEEQLNNDPHAFRGTDEDIAQALENLTEKDLDKFHSRAEEFLQRKEAVWYERIFPLLEEFIRNLQKKNGMERYAYLIRVHSFLGELPIIMEKLDAIQKDIKWSLNVILRLIYIFSWIIILHYIK